MLLKVIILGDSGCVFFPSEPFLFFFSFFELLIFFLLFGLSRVGKTSLMNQYVQNPSFMFSIIAVNSLTDDFFSKSTNF